VTAGAFVADCGGFGADARKWAGLRAQSASKKKTRKSTPRPAPAAPREGEHSGTLVDRVLARRR
jgi:hypothetical protein